MTKAKAFVTAAAFKASLEVRLRKVAAERAVPFSRRGERGPGKY
ncbi:hypothetical protein SAMN05444166_0837 [Singulisphaera sp. GP187]|nr:hypothetical protein [Singulisphaera sp. GP187]SIN78529.1 hypothetical protein SAMN05444166_0837 [Singulisphaera sp. GP187]